MKELFNEQEVKTGQINNEPLAKIPGYTSEQYLDDILDFFYSFGRYESKKNFDDFRIIDERSLQENSDIKFIKETEKYNFNIIERYVLLYLAVSKIKRRRRCKSEIVESLIDKKVAKPSVIVKMLSNNSKLFKNKCIKDEKSHPYDEGTIVIDDKLYSILFNTDVEENEETIKKEQKDKKTQHNA